ncbi:inositol monophosphatase family protein [Oceanibium sediminis]|uniref:inositol monophosphatase family protein n=1 Tax=Oceanibium sediminis TaxID=2026339 RepID=UPI000DD345A6|nr:inositol monophosphatase family protein [Oceanibium sediminis]
MPDVTTKAIPSIAQTAHDLAEAARETALRHFRRALDIQLKGDESPVTRADKEIEQQARALLQQRFPDHAILGEEYGAGDLRAEHVWVIDPIDGTRSFICGHPLFGFLLAHMERGALTTGVISMPALDELYIGCKGAVATLNGDPIKVSGRTRLADAFLTINEGEKLLAEEPEVLRRLLQAGHTRRFGYDCYPHALLAAGHIDAVVDFDLKPFDYLPLAGVIEAAGGVISDWSGNPLGYESDGRVISAATPELHAALLGLIADGATI